MQLTNYALTLLLPAYLAAAQGGAESVGNDIGQGLGAVSFPPLSITNSQTHLTTSIGNFCPWRSWCHSYGCCWRSR
jgi:hypothetical protein